MNTTTIMWKLLENVGLKGLTKARAANAQKELRKGGLKWGK